MIKSIIEFFETNNEKEFGDVMKYINESTRQIFDSELEHVMNNIENDVQKIIYLDWWNSGSLWSYDKEEQKHNRAKRYKYVSDHDWNEAQGWIMDTVSKGMG